MNAPKYESAKNVKSPDHAIKAESSHLVGTGIGAVAGGAVAGAAVGTVAGPVGTIAGATVGAVVGAIAGKSVAKAVNPSIEDAYWRENHRLQSFAKGRSYDDFGPAYRIGYEGYALYGVQGGTFEEREADLRRNYEASHARIAWNEARPASLAAWQRFR